MKVTVIIPSYNRSYLISSTLESIQNQTFQSWNCLVVDDHSTDETEQIVKVFSDRDSRFAFVKNTNKKGACATRNFGLNIAKGEYIVFFDSDNLMAESFLERKVRYLDNHSNIDVVTSFSIIRDETDKNVGVFTWAAEENIFKDLIIGKTYVDTNSAMIRRKSLGDFRWDEDCPSYQEWDFHLQLSASGLVYQTVWDFLTYYYRRKSGTISSDTNRDFLGKAYIFVKWFPHLLENRGKKGLIRYLDGIPNAKIFIAEALTICNTNEVPVLDFIRQYSMLLTKRKFLKLIK